MSVANKIKQNGWKQGASLYVEEETEIFYNTEYSQTKLCLPEGVYIVLSQDCDILNPDLEKEPSVELIRIRVERQRVCDSTLTSGKNPRKLHLEIADGFVEMSPNDRYFIPRNYLAEISVGDIELTERNRRLLINWITKRYRRPAFPDAFNKRIDNKARKKVKTILTQEANEILGLFIQLTQNEESSEDKTYKVILIMLVRKEIYQEKNRLNSIKSGFDKIVACLDSIEGINIESDSQVQSTDDISLHEYQKFAEWDFDYISFANTEADQAIETASDIIV